jgi:hypothetical protein
MKFLQTLTDLYFQKRSVRQKTKTGKPVFKNHPPAPGAGGC